METVYDKAQKLNSKNFKLLIGVKKETFQLMLEHLNSAYQIQHRKGGRPRSLPMEDQLIMTLRYLRYYPTQRLLAFDFGVGVATVNAIITWVEDTLRASGSFDLDHLEAPSAAVAIDVTESPIQRPKKTKAKIILVKRKIWTFLLFPKEMITLNILETSLFECRRLYRLTSPIPNFLVFHKVLPHNKSYHLLGKQ
ncbi:transposase [Streptococcus pneumoniae]|nr:transposase [Streptococcus pneumoniae]